MAKEIERKYLVKDGSYRSMASGSTEIAQYYLQDTPERTIRVRIKDNEGWLTVKGCNDGCVRDEWEYPIPVADVHQMASLPGVIGLSKTRWYVPFDGHTWEVDEFHGNLEGLVVAEVELSAPDEAIAVPPFAGTEVTGDPQYYNSVLSRRSSNTTFST